jgi:hypothetical protein
MKTLNLIEYRSILLYSDTSLLARFEQNSVKKIKLHAVIKDSKKSFMVSKVTPNTEEHYISVNYTEAHALFSALSQIEINTKKKNKLVKREFSI